MTLGQGVEVGQRETVAVTVSDGLELGHAECVWEEQGETVKEGVTDTEAVEVPEGLSVPHVVGDVLIVDETVLERHSETVPEAE